MLNSIFNDVRRELKHGNMVIRLILINGIVFIGLLLLSVFLSLVLGAAGSKDFVFDNFLQNWFMASHDSFHILTRPWTIITYMFLHAGLGHIFFNMLIFYMFGRILGDFVGDRHILPIYIYGGIIGFVAYLISAKVPNALNVGNYMLGASAAVMSIMMATTTLRPSYVVHLFGRFQVQIKYIALTLFIFDLVGISRDANTGGHFAHFGGAIMGWFYIYNLNKGRNIGEPFNNFMDGIVNFWKGLSQPKKPKVVYRNKNKTKTSTSFFNRKNTKPSHQSDVYSNSQEKLDRILEKIKESGYDNLSDEEKEFLFKESKK